MEGNTVGMRTFINMLKILIWWDIENLGVPHDLPPDLVYEQKLRDEGFGGDIEIRIVVPFSDCVVPSVLLENMTLCRVNNFPTGATKSFKDEMEKLEIGPDRKRDPVAIREGLSFSTELKELQDSLNKEYKKQRELYGDPENDGNVPDELFEKLRMAHREMRRAGYEALRKKHESNLLEESKGESSKKGGSEGL
ncbi:hypothetical protein Bca52824_087158 [Brassica carinata]|uniref:Uncharacterized protein n=1 Tax=Brassica carinata TaxID=52824 RepID=A0A8X7TMI3_BRACI|nr:hypothetical protein Bca52824_087158 [Brassica carinata]